jgi:hypothetical protein
MKTIKLFILILLLLRCTNSEQACEKTFKRFSFLNDSISIILPKSMALVDSFTFVNPASYYSSGVYTDPDTSHLFWVNVDDYSVYAHWDKNLETMANDIYSDLSFGAKNMNIVQHIEKVGNYELCKTRGGYLDSITNKYEARGNVFYIILQKNLSN